MIKVDEEYYIDADSRSYIVFKKVVNEEGKETYKPLAYTNDITRSIEYIMKQKQKMYVTLHEELILNEVFKEFRRINAEMKDILMEIKKSEVIN